MIGKFGLSFGVLALAIAGAASGTYRVKFFEPSVIAGSELKAGEYRVAVEQNKAIIQSGKKSVEANVKVEDAPEKYRATSVIYNNADGKYLVREIHIGGTHTKLVFQD